MPDLIAALKDKVSSVRQAAAEAVGNIGPTAQAAVPALFKLIEQGYDRYAAREALQKIKPKSMQELCKALKNGSAYTRVFVCEYLGQLGPAALEAKPCIEPLTDPAMIDDKRVLQSALDALEKVRTLRTRRF